MTTVRPPGPGAPTTTGRIPGSRTSTTTGRIPTTPAADRAGLVAIGSWGLRPNCSASSCTPGDSSRLTMVRAPMARLPTTMVRALCRGSPIAVRIPTDAPRGPCTSTPRGSSRTATPSAGSRRSRPACLASSWGVSALTISTWATPARRSPSS